MTTEAAGLSPVADADAEWLARFVLFRKWIRADQTVRPDAFIPYPWPDLSVTRHLGLSQAELWQIGRDVANVRSLTLYGRADVQTVIVTKLSLRIVPTQEPKNHANITGWPKDKAEQKILALELAAAAQYVPKPAS